MSAPDPVDRSSPEADPAGEVGAPGHDDEVRGPAFWLAVVVGAALVLWGARLFVVAAGPDELVDLALWLVLADVVADWLVVPVVVLAGWLVARWAPRWAKAPLQVALMASGSVLLVGALPLAGTAPAGNPTIQPIDYGPSIAAVLVVVWLAAAVWAGVLRWRTRG